MYDDFEGLRIVSRSEDEKTLGVLRILFDPALTYRVNDEGSMILYGREKTNAISRYGLFIVQGPDYL